MLRFAHPLALCAVSFAAAGVACGGQGTSASPDAGAPAPDASVESGQPGDGGARSLVDIPEGASLLGVTTLGDVVYAIPDPDAADTSRVYAVPLAGGAPTLIATRLGAYARVSGGVVFVLGPTDASGASPLTIWTRAHGARSGLATTTQQTSALGYATGSADGEQAVYVAGATTGAWETPVPLVVAPTDGSSPTTLVASHPWAPGAAAAFASLLVSDGGADRGAVVLHYSSATDAGPAYNATITIAAFRPPTYAEEDLVTGADFFWTVDPHGTTLLTRRDDALVAYAFAARAPTIVDHGMATSSNAGSWALTSDGHRAVYVNAAGELRSAEVSSPSPVVLASAGAASTIVAVDPGGQFAIFSSPRGDAFLTPTHVPGARAIAPLWAGSPGACSTCTPFTADGQLILYGANPVPHPVGEFTVDDLMAQPLGGGPPVKVSSGTASWATLGGSKLLVDQGFVGDVRDLAVVDAATGASRVVATGVRSYVLTADRAHVVYQTATTIGVADL